MGNPLIFLYTYQNFYRLYEYISTNKGYNYFKLEETDK